MKVCNPAPNNCTIGAGQVIKGIDPFKIFAWNGWGAALPSKTFCDLRDAKFAKPPVKPFQRKSHGNADNMLSMYSTEIKI